MQCHVSSGVTSYKGASANSCLVPPEARGSGRPGQLGQLTIPLKFGTAGQKLHMALMSDTCQSNGNDHLTDFNTSETMCLHSRTA